MSEFEDITIPEKNADFSEENNNAEAESEASVQTNEEEADFQAESPKEDDVTFEEDEEDESYEPDKRPRKKKVAVIIGIAALIAAIAVVGAVAKNIKGSKDSGPKYKDVAVERRTILNTITGSSSIEPNDSYSVTTIKSGDIDADYFKEGDTVKKGDKLYQFDDEEAQKSLKTAQNSVTKAQLSLNDAQENYNKQYVKADIAGKVKEVYVSVGDNVTNGAKIADVYNDSTMKLVLPFNTNDAAAVSVGSVAEISVSGISGEISGKVTGKSSASAATEYHTSVVYVTIEVKNPGALTEKDTASAVVNGVACSDSANFQYINSHTIVSEASGTVEKVNIVTGDSVSKGTQLAYVNSSQTQNSLKTAQLSLDDAKLQLDKAQDAVDDYLIEAPIEGTVVTKNAKAGDTIDTSNSQTALCVIYDLSCVKLNIDVDETEVALVKAGQAVKVTADAVDGEFTGTVVKVPVDGVNENGVTTYTIEVEIKDYGDLLPGMNVDAKITVEEAADALAVPVNSVNRGDIVFVKDDGTKRANDVTDIINGSKNAESGEESDGKKSSDEAKQPGDRDAQGADTENIPMNIEIPEGYRAIKVETGINDTEYIEIKSGLSQGDTVRTLDTEASSANASFGDEDIMMQMHSGGMSGGMGGGMPAGGGMSGSGDTGGGRPGGGMR